MKNHGDPYKVLFSRSIVELFEAVFRKSREKDRERLFRLRQTWTPILQGSLLYTLDSTIKDKHDPAWPIQPNAKKPAVAKSNIHINPAKFKTMPSVEGLVDDMDDELKKAERELAELKRKRLEKTKREIEEVSLRLKNRHLIKNLANFVMYVNSPFSVEKTTIGGRAVILDVLIIIFFEAFFKRISNGN